MKNKKKIKDPFKEIRFTWTRDPSEKVHKDKKNKRVRRKRTKDIIKEYKEELEEEFENVEFL